MPPSSTDRLLAVTIGEPAGIGPDIILKAWNERKKRKLPPFFVIGDAGLLTRRAHEMGVAVTTAALARGELPSPLSTALPVLALDGAMVSRSGAPDRHDSALVIAAIDLAVEMAMLGEIAGIVTCPIAKSILYEAGFDAPGHTEYLAKCAQQFGAEPCRPVMMIAGPQLRTVPVTIHLPLREVAAKLTTKVIVETCEIVARDLSSRFGIADPRLAVAGLNPHAGENGALGDEDNDVVAPAVKRLNAMGINAKGPFPADTMFHEKARSSYDAAICMYHDQALIPAKTLSFDEGVNVTLGLPFIRTSPDHGTAFDIAGTGKADPTSFCKALKLAGQMAGHN